ncbi:uncharacterized protein LOC109819562 isoform X2 [Asparagus officinalis]|uniref:uncharacterized protein LOC109819562 isoform X2 n=1 Tax=Asparagus officinalis TaxID=4686 RepID=UPI00098DF529|nr:uncharacterized protein LOC109819562 isoform X2 [Asparagus officinalis]
MQLHCYSLLSCYSTFCISPPFFSQFRPQFPKPNKNPAPILSSNKANPDPKPNSTNKTLNLSKQPEPLELLTKPEKPENPNSAEPETPSEDFSEALAPFLKFFKSDGSESDSDDEAIEFADTHQPISPKLEEVTDVSVKYYEPKRGDFAVGVVVSGNENKLDVNVGADLLGTMLTKEVMPLYGAELDYLLCDLEKEREREEFMAKGRMGVVRDEEVLSREKVEGRPVVEVGTVLFAEVLGRTLSGRPLLSSRRMYRRVAWHRVRQIKQLNEPIQVKIFEWNTGGLLTRIEGLRAFLPKAELMKRVNSFMDLKENVGRQLYVSIVRVDETTNDLIISEKEAWDMLNLKEGTLLDGTVRRIFQYGAQIRIGDTNRSGLLHISNITRARVPSVSEVLEVGEKLKVLVVKSMFPDKIALRHSVENKSYCWGKNLFQFDFMQEDGEEILYLVLQENLK